LLKQRLHEQYSEKIDLLEANILAYQDLLIIKETEIRELETKLRPSNSQAEANDEAKATIANMQKDLAEAHKELVKIKNPPSYTCCPFHFRNNHLEGPCSKLLVSKFVSHTIQSLNDNSKRRVEEIKDLLRKEFEEYKKNSEEKLKEKQEDFDRKLQELE
jgi:hypothetical protein